MIIVGTECIGTNNDDLLVGGFEQADHEDVQPDLQPLRQDLRQENKPQGTCFCQIKRPKNVNPIIK